MISPALRLRCNQDCQLFTHSIVGQQQIGIEPLATAKCERVGPRHAPPQQVFGSVVDEWETVVLLPTVTPQSADLRLAQFIVVNGTQYNIRPNPYPDGDTLRVILYEMRVIEAQP